MARNLYQSQYILDKCFENRKSALRMSLNNSQDYLNAVFDASKGALRVNIAGGILPAVSGSESLPPSAGDGQICPVVNEEAGGIDFYQWDEESGEWKLKGSTNAGGVQPGDGLTDDQRETLEWVTDHLDQIKEVSDFDYIIKVDDIVLDPNSTRLVVQGHEQDIDDDLDGDDDDTTPYRIDVNGYVLNVANYASNESPVMDRYYTRINYDSAMGGLGMSHIYLEQAEYDYFSNLQEGKNVLRVYYMSNAMHSPVKHKRYVLNPDRTAIDDEGNVLQIEDVEDIDNDHDTVCRLETPGYVVGTETYASSEALIPDRYYVKTVYESDGVHQGKSIIYMDTAEYEEFSHFTNDRNILDVYYIGTVFPASVTVSETQLAFPLTEGSEKVVIDAAGNPINVADDPDKDNDPETNIRITVNGFVLDIDGYESNEDRQKRRFLNMMSYNRDVDTTDIYFRQQDYDQIAELQNGRNIVSIYTVGAGIGTDASRLTLVDSVLDSNSDKAIQNRAVKEAVDALHQEIQALREEIEALRQ